MLKIIFNSLATAAIGSVVAGFLSFCYVIVSKPDHAAAAVPQGVAVGIMAGLAGLILGVVGSLLFPESYLKVLGFVVLLIVGLLWLIWVILNRLA